MQLRDGEREGSGGEGRGRGGGGEGRERGRGRGEDKASKTGGADLTSLVLVLPVPLCQLALQLLHPTLVRGTEHTTRSPSPLPVTDGYPTSVMECCALRCIWACSN